MRVGIGYDVHALKKNESLIIGGVKIEHSLGLLGHSDADVLVHSIMDALLGAAGLGDIGKHFPDTDEQYKGISSLKLLVLVKEKLEFHGFRVNNIDSVIIAQKPKLAAYINQMEKNISEALNMDQSLVNIKATTTERLGFVGREEGIASESIVSII
ncbi:MAG TPA: 2-C-methyl-D-erythritol 2,4-cyclodiphosphate synthase [Clostridia bacterium]|nr:2-C-methyl-D-erythritol 2,4-cyclodiphosphate synthase [Clostridia bacterium]